MIKAEHVLSEISETATSNNLPIIGPEKGKYLAEEIRKANPKRVLEVGTLVGYSTILMGREMTSDSEIVTIEIDKNEAVEAGHNVVEAGVAAKVKIVIGNAVDVIPVLDGSFDFAFIDAEKAQYLRYLKLVEPKLTKGAVVFADNAGIFADEMADYLNYVRSSGNYKSRYIQVGDDGVEISVKL